MKKILLYSCLSAVLWVALPGFLLGQHALRIKVISATDSTAAISGATVQTDDKKYHAVTDSAGMVTMKGAAAGQRATVRHLAYQNQSFVLPARGNTTVALVPVQGNVEEVLVSTGYYSLPKERLTGSFTHIDNEMLNRSPSSNLLDRLEGIANGLQFDRSGLSGEDIGGEPSLRIRGTSTLHSDSRPLIIVDNFPFEGSLESINPNDVESVTLLRDASAASIWGARAGNGVIVIDMKKGRYGQKGEVSFQTFSRFQERPDIFRNRNVLLPETVLDVQRQLFENGVYTETDVSRVPVYVEQLIKHRDNLIDEEEFRRLERSYMESDIRRHASEHIYRPALQQQYNISARGGESSYRYNVFAAYDRTWEAVVGRESDRLAVGWQNGLRLGKRFELEGTARYTLSGSKGNGFSFETLGNENIYLPLVDGEGNPLPVMHSTQQIRYAYQESAPGDGLLDWMYRPLDELDENRITSTAKNLLLGLNMSYSTRIGIRLAANYQFSNVSRTGETYHSEHSYYSRNLVNRFTQANGNKIVPEGGVLSYATPTNGTGHSVRLQANYSRQWADRWDYTGLGGMEGSHTESRSGVPFTFFGYDPETEIGTPQIMILRQNYPTRPESNAMVPYPYTHPSRTVGRNLSVFHNTGLSYNSRYLFNASLRWDGSNLLGVKTNERGVLLWSAGLGWNMEKEGFFDSRSVSLLKLRGTYGSAGNINKTQGHLPVISKNHSPLFNVAYAQLVSPGNPSLRWEQVNTLNLGLDWGLWESKLSGSIEYFRKDAKYLLSNMAIDPTVGVSSSFMQNYADMRTSGFDLMLSGRNRIGSVVLENTVLLNYATNTVTNISNNVVPNIGEYFASRHYIVGESSDVIYAKPWYGLNPENGQSLVYIDGEVSTDYRAYYDGLTVDDLIKAGVGVAPLFGSLRTGLSWKGCSISVLLIYKGGHVFRRNSMWPGAELTQNGHYFYHMDYYRRWEKPGDERHTDVPAAVDQYNSTAGLVYRYSEALITPLDHVRLQDLTLSYHIGARFLKKYSVNGLSLVCTANNLGVVWKKTSEDIHPEYPGTIYPPGRQFHIGIRLNL